MNIKFLIASLFISSMVMAAPPTEDGKAIFTARCAACHNVSKQLTGPALAGVDQRRSMDWIVNFVQSSQTVIKNGDKDAVALFEKFNKIPMPDHKDLDAEKIKSIVEYIKAEAAVAAKPKEETPKEKPAVPLTTNDYLVYSMLGGSIVLLLLSLFAWVRILKLRTERLAAK